MRIFFFLWFSYVNPNHNRRIESNHLGQDKCFPRCLQCLWSFAWHRSIRYWIGNQWQHWPRSNRSSKSWSSFWLYSTLPRKLWPDNFDPIFFCPQTNFDPIFFVLKNFDFMTTLIPNQLWSHLLCPQKLWLHDNFALRPTLIPFILSPKTLTSWQLWSQTNFDPIYFVLKNFDFLTTLPSDQLWSHLFCPQKLWLHDNFDPIYFVLKLTLPSKLCPQTNFVLKNFGLRLTLISNQLILYSATASIAASTVSSFSERFKGLYKLGIWAC